MGYTRKNFKNERNKHSFRGNFEDRSSGLKSRTFQGSVPSKERVTDPSLLLNTKAFRDLQNVGVIEMKADPNSEIVRGSYPYAIIARTNRVLDAKYADPVNIQGNSITLLQNSNVTQMLNNIDVATINLRINYLYLLYESAQNGHNNVEMNREMFKSFNEAIAKAYSTMFTQLPFYTDTQQTGMPVPDGISDSEMYGKMGALLHYQTVLQNTVAPVAKYISMRSLEQHIMNMSYRRESPLLTKLYGLFKKAAFVATLNAIGTNIIGDYFDSSWYRQNNAISSLCSRKSNSMVDPLLTATVTTAIPSATFKAGNVTYYNYETDMAISGVFVNPDTFMYDGTVADPATLNYEQIIYRLCRMMDVSTMITWARKVTVGILDANSPLTTASAYYESVNKLIEAVITLSSKFNAKMSDVRSFLDKMSSSGMLYWEKGKILNVDKIEQVEPSYNMLLAHVYANYLGGANKMVYDTSTSRWKCFTLWNKYEGIAEFDRLVGGSFITFSLRNLEAAETAPSSAHLIPILFAADIAPQVGANPVKCRGCSRNGVGVKIDPIVLSDISADPIFARLNSLRNDEISFKVPSCALDLDTDANNRLASAVLAFLTNIVGYGRVGIASTYVQSLDPDYLCFLDVELEDVGNQVIQYCRNYSPFRVTTPDGRRTIGFQAVGGAE